MLLQPTTSAAGTGIPTASLAGLAQCTNPTIWAQCGFRHIAGIIISGLTESDLQQCLLSPGAEEQPPADIFPPDDYILAAAFYVLREVIIRKGDSDKSLLAAFLMVMFSNEENMFFEEGLPVIESYPVLRTPSVLQLLRLGLQTFRPTYRQEHGHDVLTLIVGLPDDDICPDFSALSVS